MHAGNGYNVCDSGYKLPLMYLVMFVPLLLSGPGKLSLDHWLARRFIKPDAVRTSRASGGAWGARRPAFA